MSKQYIGDSVYVDFDGFGLMLTTENGLGPNNAIYMEPEVWTALTKYVENLKALSNAEGNQEGGSKSHAEGGNQEGGSK